MKHALFVLVFISGPALAGIDPGNWEFSVESPLAQNKNGPVVKQRCITPEEARDPEKVLADAADSRCQLANARDNGSEYTFDLSCTKTRVPVTGKGSVRYKPDSLDGHIDLVGERQGIRLKTRSFVSARRLGPCKE
jgi:hypothetical protein